MGGGNEEQKPTNAQTVLNVGCGTPDKKIDHIFPGAKVVRLDIDPGVKPDVVSLAWDLPYEEQSFDVVFASHVLEHCYRTKIPDSIKEWARVGKDVWVVVPDLGFAIDRIIRTQTLDMVSIGMIWGEGAENDNQYHKIGFTLPILRQLIEGCGCDVKRAETVPFEITSSQGTFIARQILAVYSLGDLRIDIPNIPSIPAGIEMVETQ